MVRHRLYLALKLGQQLLGLLLQLAVEVLCSPRQLVCHLLGLRHHRVAGEVLLNRTLVSGPEVCFGSCLGPASQLCTCLTAL